MSLRYRLLSIENTVPFEDVVNSWRKKRTDWINSTKDAGHSASLLAKRALELIDALTPVAQDEYWPEDKALAAAREGLRSIAGGKQNDPLGRKLQLLFTDLEKRLISPPPPSEVELMGPGTPKLLDIGDEGPDLKEGQRCAALDIRMMWLNASVARIRQSPDDDPPGGQCQYRIHYEGWKSKWDEWIHKESGRVIHDLAKAPMVTEPPADKSKKDAKAGRAGSKGKGEPMKVTKTRTRPSTQPAKALPAAAAPAAVVQTTAAQKAAQVAKAAAQAAKDDAEDDAMDGFPRAPAGSSVVHRGEMVKYDETIVALDIRQVHPARGAAGRLARHHEPTQVTEQCAR